MFFKVILLQSLITLFGDGTLSTDKVDYGIAFTPDENVAYVVRHDGKWGSRENPPSKIHRYVKKDENWINSGYADFSDKDSPWSDSDVFISQNGEKAFFVSNRPYSGKKGNRDPDIWMVKKDGNSWGEPTPLDIINSDGYEASPVTDGDGNVYFTSIREEGPGLGDIYVSMITKDGRYSKPKLLEGKVNSPHGEWNLIISLQGDWMIFESSGRPEGLSPYGDLYFSKKDKFGMWSSPVHIDRINTTGSDLNPRIIYESKIIVWASSKELGHTGSNFYSLNFEELGFEISQD